MTADDIQTEGGRITKMEVDYSNNCDVKIPECKKLAQEGKLHDALDQLLALEKLTRTVRSNPNIFCFLKFRFVIVLFTFVQKFYIFQCLQSADMVSTSRILVAICEICLEAKNWTALNEHIVLLSKRRSQLKQAVTKMVQECCTYVDKTPDRETMIKLIETLRSVTEGKVKNMISEQIKTIFANLF